MFNIPKKYIHNKVLNKSIFIPKEETNRNKKIIRENLKKVRLGSQIEGEEIPSYVTDKYNVSAIMILDIELKNIRYAEFLNRIYQNEFKVFVIIRFTDDKGHIKFGLGYKRLSQTNKNEIVLEDYFVTEEFTEDFLDEDFNNYKKYLNYDDIVNKTDKLSFYTEVMLKSYLINNRSNIKSYKEILNSKIWYNQSNMLLVYRILEGKIEIKDKISKANLTKEKIEYNKELVKLRDRIQIIIA